MFFLLKTFTPLRNIIITDMFLSVTVFEAFLGAYIQI